MSVIHDGNTEGHHSLSRQTHVPEGYSTHVIAAGLAFGDAILDRFVINANRIVPPKPHRTAPPVTCPLLQGDRLGLEPAIGLPESVVGICGMRSGGRWTVKLGPTVQANPAPRGRSGRPQCPSRPGSGKSIRQLPEDRSGLTAHHCNRHPRRYHCSLSVFVSGPIMNNLVVSGVANDRGPGARVGAMLAEAFRGVDVPRCCRRRSAEGCAAIRTPVAGGVPLPAIGVSPLSTCGPGIGGSRVVARLRGLASASSGSCGDRPITPSPCRCGRHRSPQSA